MESRTISCHFLSLNDASGSNRADVQWEEKEKGKKTCPVCNSIDPDRFVQLLVNGAAVVGWEWSEKSPTYCNTPEGRFYAIHLQDKSVEWIHTYAMLLAKYTGVLFYWRREQLKFRSYAERQPYCNTDLAITSEATLRKIEAEELKHYKAHKL